jgi:hypothetical protein
MPYTLTLVANGIRCHYTSTASQTDVAEAIAQIGAELDGRSIKFVIHDFSCAEELDSGIAAQLTFALKFRGKVSIGNLERVAVVTGEENLGYLVEELKKHSTHQTQVFKSLADAEAWVRATDK